jgi:hypothetical protein
LPVSWPRSSARMAGAFCWLDWMLTVNGSIAVDNAEAIPKLSLP